MMDLLNQQIKSRVNGTQRFLAKRLSHHLRVMAAQRLAGATLEIRTFRADAQLVHELRAWVSEQRPELAKPADAAQPAISHVLDAALAFHTLFDDAAGVDFARNHLPVFLDEDGLHFCLPDRVDIHWVESRSKLHFDRPGRHVGKAIFKDTIYADRYLPLLILRGGELALGFSPRNCLRFVPAGTARQPIPIDRVFDLLGPLLMDRGRAVTDSLADLRQRARQSGVVLLSINRGAAADLQHRATRQTLETDDRHRLALIQAMHYFCVKNEVLSCLFKNPKADKKTLDLQSIQQDIRKNCTFKVKLNATDVDKTIKMEEGDLALPALAAWTSLLHTLNDKKLLGVEVDRVQLDGVLRAWFLKDPTGEARTHQAVRKNYSLPLIPSMGGAVRIRRRDNNGTAIWQTLSPEGLLNCGFAVVDGRIDFGQETPLPIIAQSPDRKSVV